ncbi:MAG: ATP-binding cassette domain-containing protein [Chloroflexota bacterium]|nr:ATP-binding cassette domain-containing protein [Chloroflexota bacterium]
MTTTPAERAVIEMTGVQIWTPEKFVILDDICWTVRAGEHWALLGPNGSGKSTLLSLAAATRHPSAGTVAVLGGRLGRVDLRQLRRRIGVVDPNTRVLDWLTVEDFVLTGASASIWPLWDEYGPPERERMRELLTLVGAAAIAERPIITSSQGERQRVRIARALMRDPDLLLLDEPAVGLDFPAREALLDALQALAAAKPDLSTVLVTHYLEELPRSTTHLLLLREGRVVVAGPIDDSLSSGAVSACFGLDVRIGRDHGRWWARSSPHWELG